MQHDPLVSLVPLSGVRRDDLPRPGAEHVSVETATPEQQTFGGLVDRHLVACRRAQQTLAVLAIGVETVIGPFGTVDAAREQRLIQEFGQRLRARVRGTDTVVWQGGRLYGVILQACRPEGALAVQRRLQQMLAGPYRIGEELLQASLSIGCACYPGAAPDGRGLVTVASDARRVSAAATLGAAATNGSTRPTRCA